MVKHRDDRRKTGNDESARFMDMGQTPNFVNWDFCRMTSSSGKCVNNSVEIYIKIGYKRKKNLRKKDWYIFYRLK